MPGALFGEKDEKKRVLEEETGAKLTFKAIILTLTLTLILILTLFLTLAVRL